MAKSKTENYSIYKNKKETEYTIKTKVYQKRKHLVVPVTMMVEGVHSGSAGPLLHTIGELGRYPASWNGIPVMINHPSKDGSPISANSPELIDNECVGRVYNTFVDEKKLKANVWLDEAKLKEVSEDTYNCIIEKQPIEVSVGVFTDDEDEEGEYNGETYEAVAHNHRPDHLALLPGGVGACSIEDGCGIRANKKGGKNVEIGIREALRLLNTNNYRVSEMEVNEEDGYIVKMDAVRQALYAKDSSTAYYYLEEMYDGYLIYSESLKEGGRHLYKQSYTYIDDVVEFVGDPVEVQKKVDVKYEVVTNTEQETTINNNNSKNKEDSEMGKCTDCVKKKVDALIANEVTAFEETDREFLQGLSEEQLDKMVPKTPEAAPAVNTARPGKEKNEEQAPQTLSEQDRADLNWARAQRAERRAKMAQGIQANTEKDLWSEAELTAMNDVQLEKLYNSVKKVAVKEEAYDYSLQNAGGNFNTNAGDEEILPPTGYSFEETK